MLWNSVQRFQRRMWLPKLKAQSQPTLILVGIEAFQQWLLPELLWIQKIAFFLGSATNVATFWKCAANAKRTCTLCFLARGSLFSGKGKYSCQLPACYLLAELDLTLPECSFLSTGPKQWQQKMVSQWSPGENFVHQNLILYVIYTHLCIIGNTDIFNRISAIPQPRSNSKYKYIHGFYITSPLPLCHGCANTNSIPG